MRAEWGSRGCGNIRTWSCKSTAPGIEEFLWRKCKMTLHQTERVKGHSFTFLLLTARANITSTNIQHTWLSGNSGYGQCFSVALPAALKSESCYKQCLCEAKARGCPALMQVPLQWIITPSICIHRHFRTKRLCIHTQPQRPYSLTLWNV